MTVDALEGKLLKREEQILNAQKRGDAESIFPLLADDFIEIGSSGRMFSKADILQALSSTTLLEFALEQAKVLRLAEGCSLLTYIAAIRRRSASQETGSRSYRSSIWVERAGNWQILFHQGTTIRPTGPASV